MITLDYNVIREKFNVDMNHVYGEHIDLTNNEKVSAKLIRFNTELKSERLHYHKLKDETFICIAGITGLEVIFSDAKWPDLATIPTLITLKVGDEIRIKPGNAHRIFIHDKDFLGSVVLEVATHDDDEDTYYIGEDKSNGTTE